MPELKHFDRWEFGKWWGDMRPELLRAVDEFRDSWGMPFIIRFRWDGPDVAGRLGRHQGPDGTSDHNIDRHGEVRAIDCFPLGMDTRQDMERAVALAERCGINAIGVYPHWKPSPGLHLGQRPESSRTAHWGGIRDDGEQEIVPMIVALEQVR